MARKNTPKIDKNYRLQTKKKIKKLVKLQFNIVAMFKKKRNIIKT